MKFNLLALLVFCFLILSCNRNKKTESTVTNSGPYKIEEQDKNYILPLLYATNRLKEKKGDGFEKIFTGRWSSKLTYGLLEVSIPKIHKEGNVENAGFIEKLKGNNRDSTKYFVLRNNKFLESPKFYEQLIDFMGEENDSNQAFIFIHGYNNSFAEAAKRSAQIFFDLKAVGVPILFSWPSRGNPIFYTKDKESVDDTKVVFKEFMKETLKNVGNRKINIIAHSMGNRLMTQSLEDLHKEFPEAKFNHIIMAAPDVGVGEFNKRYFEPLKKLSNSLTLYCSDKDKALIASAAINQQKRLGSAGTNLFVKNPMNTIDVSNISCDDILAHTCFAQTNQVLVDIKNIISQSDLDSSPVKRLRREIIRNKELLYYFNLF